MDISAKDASPLGDRFSIELVIQGTADDLRDLRSGKIGVEDARVRAELAKQFMNGVRVMMNAQKFLEERARLVHNNGENGADGEPATP